MTTKDKVARRKLSLLQLATELSNVSRACSAMGYSRQQFYEIRRNFQTYGNVLPTSEAGGARIEVVLSDNRWPYGHRSDLWKKRGQETAEEPGVLRQARPAPL